MHPRVRRTFALVAFLIAVASLFGTGCASRMASTRTDVPTVLKVQVKSADKQRLAYPQAAIRAELAQRQTSILHFIPPFTFFQPRYYLEGTDWRDDRTRIVNFFNLRGYFDAKVVASQVVSGKRKRPNGDPEFVKVVHSVQQGERSQVRKVRIQVAAAPDVREEIREALIPELTFAPKDPFSMEAVYASEDAFLTWLRSESYAIAEVRSKVDAFPDDKAVDVTFIVTPGEESVFGEVRITGLDRVKERYVRRHVRMKTGELWDGGEVQETKRYIYGMGVFTMVTITPDLDHDTHDAQGRLVVPVDIALRERKPRSFTYQPGVEWDIQGFSLLPAAFVFENVNLGQRLVKATATVEAGYRFLSLADHFPTGLAGLSFEWPDWPARHLTVRAGTDIELGVEKGYKFWTPGARVGLGWAARPFLKFSFDYNLEYYDILPSSVRIGPVPYIPSPCPEVGKLPGECTPPTDGRVPEFDDNFLLSYFRQTAVLDLRDNPLAANKGALVQLAIDQAFPFGRLPNGELLGFRYIKLEAEARGFIPVVPKRFVVAMRAGAAHLLTWGDEHDLPISKAVFLGGDGTVRGFKSRYLGPRGLDANCTTGDCIVPLGARSGASGSVELRVRPIPTAGLWLAGFTDFGRTWGDSSTDTNVPSPELQEYEALLYQDGLQFSVGGGVRYDLGSIGRIRIDFAARIRRWPEELGTVKERFPWNIHFNLSESF